MLGFYNLSMQALMLFSFVTNQLEAIASVYHATTSLFISP